MGLVSPMSATVLFLDTFKKNPLDKIPDPRLRAFSSCGKKLGLWPIFWEFAQYSKYLSSKVKDLESCSGSWWKKDVWKMSKYSLGKQGQGSGILSLVFIKRGSWKSLNTDLASKVRDLESCPRSWWKKGVWKISKYSLVKQSQGSGILSKVLIKRDSWKSLNTALAGKVKDLECCPRSWSRKVSGNL